MGAPRVICPRRERRAAERLRRRRGAHAGRRTRTNACNHAALRRASDRHSLPMDLFNERARFESACWDVGAVRLADMALGAATHSGDPTTIAFAAADFGQVAQQQPNALGLEQATASDARVEALRAVPGAMDSLNLEALGQRDRALRERFFAARSGDALLRMAHLPDRAGGRSEPR